MADLTILPTDIPGIEIRVNIVETWGNWTFWHQKLELANNACIKDKYWPKPIENEFQGKTKSEAHEI